MNLSLDRMKDALRYEHDTELASELDIGASTLSSWRTRGTMNYDKVFEFCVRHSLSIDWIMLGKNSQNSNLDFGSTQNVNNVLNRLKEVFNIESDVDLARKLGVQKNVISNWRLRNKADYSKLFNYSSEYGVSLDWLLTGFGHPTGSMDNSDHSQDKRIPLIPITAAAGFPAENNYQVSYIEDWYVIPDFKYVDFLIKARGDSMYPKYRSGDVLACRKISNDSFIQWGRTYVVDTPQDTLVKRLYPGGDHHIICKSENERYPDFDISKDDIRSIAIVVGVVRLE